MVAQGLFAAQALFLWGEVRPCSCGAVTGCKMHKLLTVVVKIVNKFPGAGFEVDRLVD